MLRGFALLAALFYLPVAWVWAYGLAGLALPLPLLALAAVNWAERRDQRAGRTPTPTQRILQTSTRVAAWLGLAVSAVALIATLIAN